ncbi:sigma factor-like helix-turn-helix DNA-binding protein [Streptomyces sp. NPDC058620]|uniref:sigma factor-like helix-turn-helix DNA-binding protein n=1 Tax=Streptomyces sp. NPDC058620 TaxID=3346560 RepID=UPI00364A19CF
MRERQADRQRRRAQEFEDFVAGAAGRLLHTATLFTAEPAEPAGANLRALRLLTAALAHTYAEWDRLRGDDPYDRTRQELVIRFARDAWRHHRPRGGLLERLTPQERLVLVLRLYEGVAEEQAAALLGLPAERVRAICTRAVGTMYAPPEPPEHPGRPGRPVARLLRGAR